MAKIQYKSGWESRENRSGMAYSPRGDEVREFAIDGESGRMSVSWLSGGWMVSVHIGEESIFSTPGWGHSRKAEAKSRAIRALRDYVSAVERKASEATA